MLHILLILQNADACYFLFIGKQNPLIPGRFIVPKRTWPGRGTFISGLSRAFRDCPGHSGTVPGNPGHLVTLHFYSASSSPLLPRSAPNTARMLCRSFTPKRHRQLRVKDLPKVPKFPELRLDQDSNPRPSDGKASILPMLHKKCPHPVTYSIVSGFQAKYDEITIKRS